MKHQETLDTLVEMSDEDLIVLFERLSVHVSERERSFRSTLRSALFPQKRLRKHQDKIGGCRAFVSQNGFITLHHAKENKLIDSNTASTTWLRCFIRPLLEEGVIEEYGQRWKGPNTRGTGMKVYTRPGITPSLFSSQHLPGFSLITDASKCAKVFIEQVLSKSNRMRKGFVKDGELEMFLVNAKSGGEPVFRDVSDETIRDWLESTVKPMLTEKKDEDPKFRVYHVHGAKVSVSMVGGLNE